MKRWNRTTLKWFFDNFQTNMPITPNVLGIGEKFVVTQKSLNIISLPEKHKCRLIFMLKDAEEWRSIIEERLMLAITPARRLSIIPSNQPSIFTLELFLLKNEHFCDAAIRIAQAIFKVLGIHDPHNNRIRLFSVEQETFVWHDGSWTPFSVYLCIKHKLITPRAKAR